MVQDRSCEVTRHYYMALKPVLGTKKLKDYNEMTEVTGLAVYSRRKQRCYHRNTMCVSRYIKFGDQRNSGREMNLWLNLVEDSVIVYVGIFTTDSLNCLKQIRNHKYVVFCNIVRSFYLLYLHIGSWSVKDGGQKIGGQYKSWIRRRSPR